MPLVTVPAHDPRIVYSGSRWKDDLFEIRPGIDPPSGGGVNATATSDLLGDVAEVCKLGVKSRETWGFGNGFSFTFTGVAVRLVMESRQDHGIYTVSLDGTPTATISGYSDAPHCGAPFVADGLALGEHTVSATLTAKDPASTWEYSYMQVFAVQYDPGSSSNSTGQGPQRANATSPSVVATQKAFSTAAIAGVTVGAFVLTFLLFVFAVWLVRRYRRRRRGSFIAVPKNDLSEYDGSEKPIPMRRNKGRRHSVLSAGELSPYTLHHQQSASSLVLASSPRSDLSATSANNGATTPARTPPPGLSPRSESWSQITAYPLPSGSMQARGPPPKSPQVFDEGTKQRPSDEDEDVAGGTMLPPYTRSSH